MNEPFQILRVGRHVAKNGAARTFEASDLDRIAELYNKREGEAPIVVGHPEQDAPAYGWIERLSLAGDRLLATPRTINRAFADLVKKGAYERISVALDGDRLRHVGFLGGAAPAVDLPNVALSAVEEETRFEFAAPEAGFARFEDRSQERALFVAELNRLSESGSLPPGLRDDFIAAAETTSRTEFSSYDLDDADGSPLAGLLRIARRTSRYFGDGMFFKEAATGRLEDRGDVADYAPRNHERK
ncbi:MAG: hypothetical protein GF419_14540 [Ignavibacteriales bacterium]|nr:hypothetical protein [Ignavibacteriales bacterium]